MFDDMPPIRFEGPDSRNPLAFRCYDAARVVAGKTMAEHLRFAVCYWHSFVWPGSDMFGSGTFDRAWMRATTFETAKEKLDAAFAFFGKLGAPFFCFHDVDVVPLGESLREGWSNLDRMADLIAAKMEGSGVKLLWGTANLFSHPRYMAGAATNPDPAVFAYAAGQVQKVLEVTHRLGGVNYVLWGGREGYETLLNTRIGQELDQLGRFIAMVVEHKHKIGFPGTILIEPKPCEPTKHQYDYDAAAVAGFLRRYGLEREVKLNIEVNHATLAGHTMLHELTYASSYGMLGSIDANRGDELIGWDTDQFPTNLYTTTQMMLVILNAGGLGRGGLNFDAKVRRESFEPVDLFHAHIGGMD
ncbi:MAG: xylose isomerase, partial [Acetobacteraceae bacterium]|nr:xylose isomerase [Acetobacteraceae bacterium]